MAGYLDSYGVVDAKRERRTKRVVIALALIVILGLALFLFFRNFSEKRAVSAFMDALRSRNYQRAYELWGCTSANPCRDYRFEKFMEDWGPSGQYANIEAAKVTNVDACGGGVVFTLEMPKIEPVGIWVERKTGTLGFAPWARCPGRHWNLGGFLKSFFSSPPPPETPKR